MIRYSKSPFLAILILLTGFVLRLYHLGADSLWYDETVSAFLAGQSPADLIAHTARDIHPPGYYLLLHFWTLTVGRTEFALTFFSLVFGMLLIALTYRLARDLVNPTVATWAALLVAFSPYHLWYSQEVRMYTLGATLGLINAYCAWQVEINYPHSKKILLFWLGYILSAMLGLYTLYYFAFLLIAINFFVILTGPGRLAQVGFFNKKRAKFSLFSANILILIAYLPWLPTAWRQVTYPPVPSWRTFDNGALWPILLESWSALSLGQSVEPQTVWPILLFTLVLFYLGLRYLNGLPDAPNSSQSDQSLSFIRILFLLMYLLGPMLLIYFLSAITPLYHVRYLFTYSPAFYIILGAGLAWLTIHTRAWIVPAVAGLLLAACLFSLYRFHFGPLYRTDDYRAAVRFIQNRWQPGDVIMANAGYVYPAFLYYTDWPNLQCQRLVPYSSPGGADQPLLLQTGSVEGSPQLGWGDPQVDFYAMSATDTVAALDKLSSDYARLWLLRAYDTVTDPNGLIRNWLAGHTIPLEDEVFNGESNIRAQGFLLAGANKNLPAGSQIVEFEDGMVLQGWLWPQQTWQAGQTILVKLWWQVHHQTGVDYKMSLKLWTPAGQLAAQGQDTWPVGTQYRTTTWPIGRPVYQPATISLPPDLLPGQYWLNVELYHPDTGQPLSRLDGAAPVVTLGPVVIE